MKTPKGARGISVYAEQRALQQYHHRVFRRALKLARNAGRRATN